MGLPEHGLEGLVGLAVVLLIRSPEAHLVHVILIAILGAGSFSGVDAVVLLVNEASHCSYFAPEIVKSVDADVDHSLAVLDPILANQVASFASVDKIIAVSGVFAIRVLHIRLFVHCMA